jgi:hypothetical protein
MKDYQRQKLYDFEKLLPNWDDILRDLSWCEETTAQFLYEYNVPMVKITDGRSRKSACYNSRLHEIKLPRIYRYDQVVLHETAHAIVHKYKTDNNLTIPHHGKEFVRVYMELLSSYFNYDLLSLIKAVKSFGLDIDTKNYKPTKQQTITISL